MAVYAQQPLGYYEKISEAYNIDIANVRLVRERQLPYGGKRIDSPELIAEFSQRFLEDMDREIIMIYNLNTKCEIINLNIASVGTVNYSLTSPREIFKSAILSNATCIAMVHNHPSGDITPSDDDIELTDRISKAGQLLGIKLIDHIIVGPYRSNYYSFQEERQEWFNKPRISYPIDVDDLLEMEQKASKNKADNNVTVRSKYI